MVESTRLCIKGNPGSSIVRTALFKAFHSYCIAQNVDWMLAAGRRPVDRIYEKLMFSDVGEQNHFYPMAHANGLEHRVMYLSPKQVQPLWTSTAHIHTDFFFERIHPDIDISGAKNIDSVIWAYPEANPMQTTMEKVTPYGPRLPTISASDLSTQAPQLHLNIRGAPNQF